MKIATFHLLTGEVREIAWDETKPCASCGLPRQEAPWRYQSFQQGLCRRCDEEPKRDSPGDTPRPPVS